MSPRGFLLGTRHAIVVLSIVVGALLASPPAGPNPASAITQTLRAPFPPGHIWTVCQSYRGPTHSSNWPLDIGWTASSCSPGNNDTGDKTIVAPGSGLITHLPTTTTGGDFICLSLTGGGSVALGHVEPSVSEGPVTAGQSIGVARPAGEGQNNGIAHLHFEAWSGNTCYSGTPQALSGAWTIECNPAMPANTTVGYYIGTKLSACTSSETDSFGGETFAASLLSFMSGTHTGYQFNPDGSIASSKSSTLGSSSSASASRRAAIPAHSGTWFYVINGIWAGYWVRESTAVYMSWSPARTIHWNAGTYVGYTYDSSGTVTGSKSGSIGSGGSSASAGGAAIINGGLHYRISNGIWAGYWMPASGQAYETISTSTVHFDPGSHTGYIFRQDGSVESTKTGTIGSNGSSASANGIVKLGNTWYFHITNGVWAGYWITQRPASYQVISPEHTIHFDPGTYTGYRFDANGNVVSSKAGTIGGSGSSAPARGTAMIKGQSYYLISAGIWEEYWVRESVNVYPN